MLAKPPGSDNDCFVKLTVSVRTDCPFTEPEERRRGGGPRPKTATEKIAHFWARVQRGAPDACWLWQGGCYKSGYGQVALGSRIPGYAHRIAYQLTRGSIPAGLVVRHKCDVPRCCNPNHLEIGTQADNLQDARDRGRLDESLPRPGRWAIEPTLRRRLMAEALAAPRRSGVVARLAREHGLNFRSFAVAVIRARQKTHRLSLRRTS
jgi:hypothetical protein